MLLIKGSNLTGRQISHVLSQFMLRWTIENERRITAWAGASGKPTTELQSDAEWLANHAFWFINDGSRLTLNRCCIEDIPIEEATDGLREIRS